MSRARKILLKQCHRMGWDNEALWALLAVFSLTLIFQLIERGYF
jgi:hypothetical protein